MLKFPAPRTPRDLFLLLGQLEATDSLEDLISRVDLTNMSAACVFQAAFFAPPELTRLPLPFPGYDAGVDLVETIRSAAFQENCLGTLLKAFPEKRRSVFLHIPKCSGTDLILNLADRLVSLSKRLEDRGWTDPDTFLRTMAQSIRHLLLAPDVFVNGHITLREYLRLIGPRPDDRLITILRDPLEQLVSQVNYGISRIVQDPQGHSPDARGVLEALQIDGLADNAGKDALRQLALGYLRKMATFSPNPICRYLSDSPDPNYLTALRGIIFYDIEITETIFYNTWLARRWGITSRSRHNRSTTFINRADVLALPDSHLTYLAGEDQKVFDVVDWAIRKEGGASISGRRLGQLLGSQPVIDALPRQIAAERGGRFPTNPIDIGGRHNLSVVAGDQAIKAFQHRVADAIARDQPDSVIVRFGLQGNCRDVVAEGWSAAEHEHRWAIGDRSTLRLARPATSGTYRFQFDIKPFIVEDVLARQQIRIRVNETEIGTMDLLERSILRFEIAWDILAASEIVMLEIGHPDAAVPSRILQVNDTRELAVMAKTLVVARVEKEERCSFL